MHNNYLKIKPGYEYIVVDHMQQTGQFVESRFSSFTLPIEERVYKKEKMTNNF